MKYDHAKIHPPDDPLRADIDDLGIMELGQSMAQLGQLQPVGITPRPDAEGEFDLVYGHRRWLAARALNWTEIDAVLVGETGQLLAKRLVENTQRAQLTDIEEAHALAQLIEETGADNPTAARLTGKSKHWVASRLSMLDWPDELQSAVHAGLIGQGVARHLATIPDPQLMLDYLGHAINSGCTTETAASWAHGARLAAQGIAAALRDPNATELPPGPPQVVEQMYTCFHCGSRHSFRSVNMLIVCRQCQDKIAETRLAQ